MKELETGFTFNEVVQAMYRKVLDVMFSFKDKGENLFPTFSTHRRLSYSHVHATYNLQFIQKMWFSTTPFFSRTWWTGYRKKGFSRWLC